ncbi:MAG: zinc ABC transporter substrate-binding protein [Ruminococcaceae bacterium]|nr:zinc ABC transporter substrate-binding protein [Oscillospiraceae bacterium]
MKFTTLLLTLALVLGILSGCGAQAPSADIAATTLPVYEFTAFLCQGTGLTVTQVVTENVSCLHDYSLSVGQVKAIEAAQVVILSGGGLEDFLTELPAGKPVIDCSSGMALLESCHNHEGGHEGHSHDHDPHFWLSPACAKIMAENICKGLTERYPQHEKLLRENLSKLLARLDALQAYGQQQLTGLSCREMLTFHDGFTYFAHSFDLEILAAVEEESGSEASAAELKELITLTRQHGLPAIFVEENGSSRSASVIADATGAAVYTLRMAMSGESYFDSMYHNIDTLKEALQ